MTTLAPILNPSTGARFPRRLLRNAPLLTQVCKIGEESQVPATVGAFTVLAPAAPINGQPFAVTDVDGGASTNAITIDGNGHNINDAATAQLTSAFGSLVFIFNSFDNEWHTLIFARAVTDAVSTDIFVTDLGEVAGSVILAGAGQPPTSIGLGDATTVGVQPFAARSDHRHRFPADQYAFVSVNAGAVAGVWTPDPDKAYTLELTGIAQEAGGAGACASFKRTLQIRNPGGVSAIDVETQDDQNATAWTLTCTAAGATIVFTFVGEAGKTINLTLEQLQAKVA